MFNPSMCCVCILFYLCVDKMSAAYDKLIRSKAAHLKESHKEVESPKHKKRTKARKGVAARKAFEFEHIYDTELRAQSLDTIVAEVRRAQPFHVPPSALIQGAAVFNISRPAKRVLDEINDARADDGDDPIDLNEIGNRMGFVDGRKINIRDLNRYMHLHEEDDRRGSIIAQNAMLGTPQTASSSYSEEQQGLFTPLPNEQLPHLRRDEDEDPDEMAPDEWDRYLDSL